MTFKDDAVRLWKSGIGRPFPCGRDKRPLVKGAHGKDGSISKDDVRGWLKTHPDAETAWVLAPRILVLDIDQHDEKHGAEQLAKALGVGARGLEQLLLGTMRVTARDGRFHGHWYFRVPDDFKFAKRHIEGVPDVEIVGPGRSGFYVVAPGSQHANGRFYSVLAGAEDSYVIKPLPDVLRALIETEDGPRARVKGSGDIHEWILGQNDPGGEPDGELARIVDAYEAHEAPYDVANNDAANLVQMDLVNAASLSGDPGLLTALDRCRAARDLRDGDAEWDRKLDGVEPPSLEVPEATGWLPEGLDRPLTREERGKDPKAGRDAEPYPVSIQHEYDFAAEYLRREHTDAEGRWTLRHWDGGRWGLWNEDEGHWSLYSAEEVTAEVEERLQGCTMHTQKAHTSQGVTTFEDLIVPVPRSTKTVPALVKAIGTRALVSEARGTSLNALRGYVPFRNGVLDVANETIIPGTPNASWDMWWSVPLNYDETGAPCPNWLEFLKSIGLDDDDIRLLRQWFGYLLSGSVSQQKMLLMLGPTRSGKGTIMRIAEAMLGDGAVGLRLARLAANFGLSSLLGKSLCTVGDMRLTRRAVEEGLAETLLSIVGDDMVDVDIKNREPVSTRLGVRFMLASNSLPKFIESSNALANRFVIIETKVSFLNNEDTELESRLLSELPGIVTWGLEGLKDLNQTQRFVQTRAGRDLVKDMVLAGSSPRRFVDEECEFGANLKVLSQDLYQAYRLWAQGKGLFVVDDTQFWQDVKEPFAGKVETVKSNGRRIRRGVALKQGR